MSAPRPRDLQQAHACLLEALDHDLGLTAERLVREAISFLNVKDPVQAVTIEEDRHGRHAAHFVDATTGVPWLVKVVRTGERYGVLDREGNRGIINATHERLIEFWDKRFPHDPVYRAQFVSCYYEGTLKAHTGGLDLHGGEPQWKLDAESLRIVVGCLL